MLICRAGRWLPSIVSGWTTMVAGMMMEATTVEIQSWAQFLAEEGAEEAIMATPIRRQTPVTEVRTMTMAPMSIPLTSPSNPRTQEASARALAFPPASHMEYWALARPSACLLRLMRVRRLWGRTNGRSTGSKWAGPSYQRIALRHLP